MSLTKCTLVFLCLTIATALGSTPDPCLTTLGLTDPTTAAPTTGPPDEEIDGVILGLRQPQGITMWDSQGTCDGQEITFWRPFLPGTEWRMAGSAAEDNFNEHPDEGIWVVREFEEPETGQPALTPAVNWEGIWDSRNHPVGVGLASIWRATCRPTHVALGDVVCQETHEPEACDDVKANFTCVRYDLVDICSYAADPLIQCAKQEEEGQDLSVWEVLPNGNPNEYLTGFFRADRQLLNQPPVVPFCMRKTTVLDITRVMREAVNAYAGKTVM